MNRNVFLFAALFCCFSRAKNPYDSFARSRGFVSSLRLSCAELFIRANAAPPIFADLLQDTENREPSVQLGRTYRGQHGGTWTYAHRTPGLPWFSQAEISVNAPQLDPRSFIEIMGRDGARFFSLGEIDDHTITLPDAEEINGAIQKISRVLKEKGISPIPVEFYEQRSGSILGYLENYIKGKLPLRARRQGLPTTHRIHDLSTHIAWMVIEPEVHSHSTYLAGEILRFAKKATEKLLQQAQRKHMSKRKKEILNWNTSLLLAPAVGDIDAGSAEFTIEVLEAISSPDKTNTDRVFAYQSAISNLYFRDIQRRLLRLPPGSEYAEGSAENAVTNTIASAWDVAKRFNPQKADALEERMAELHEDPVDAAEFQEFMARYIRNRASRSPRFTKPPPMTVERGCRETTLRLQILRQVAARLWRESNRGGN